MFPAPPLLGWFQSLIGIQRNFNLISFNFTRIDPEFQSLIGIQRNFNSSLTTYLLLHQVSIPDRDSKEFQPAALLTCVSGIYMFQSLIGIQRNFNGYVVARSVGRKRVSIPDRDSKEFQLVCAIAFPLDCSVSIPDRDSKEFQPVHSGSILGCRASCFNP